jgi:hypothetical protein
VTVYSRSGGVPTSVSSRRVRTSGSPVTATAVYQRVGGSAVRVDTTPPVEPTFVASTGGKGFNAATSVPALATVQNGDVLVAIAAGNAATASLTPPAGLTWTTLADTGVAAVRARLLVAVATGALAAGTWTWGEGSHNHSVQIGAWRNAAAPAAASAAISGPSATTVDAPSRTASAAGALLVCLGFHTSAGDTSRGFPGSMTVRRDAGSGAASGIIADEALPAAGATGTRAYTIAPGTAILAGLSVVLEPD